MDDNEIWKSYPEFPWMEVSSLGCVRTLDRVVPTKKGTYFAKGRILKQYPDNGGYLRVGFRVNGKRIGRQVHRIVAQTFLPNPNNWPQVNHKDCNPSNNNTNNLEWCTDKYNIQYREKYGISAAEALGRSLFAVNLKTLEVSRFSSQCDASRKLGVNQQNISGVVRGERNKAGGYWFTNADDKVAELTRNKFGNVMADKIEELMNDKETQLE